MHPGRPSTTAGSVASRLEPSMAVSADTTAMLLLVLVIAGGALPPPAPPRLLRLFLHLFLLLCSC